MVNHHLDYAEHDIGAHLIGVGAHVYCDTFSHYGFSGVSSRRNKVINDRFDFEGLDPDIQDYIEGKVNNFFNRYQREVGMIANMKSWLAETLSEVLGHGAVATYPDRPYLKWSFEYEYPKKNRVDHDNPDTFLKGCAALHKMFVNFSNNNNGLSSNDGVKFGGIRSTVPEILNFQGDKPSRIKQWVSAVKRGSLGGLKFFIPEYDAEPWLKKAATMQNKENSETALDTDIYRFYQAASLHRNFVLRDLLPSHGLVVA